MIVRVKVSDDIWLEDEVSTENEAFKAIARMGEIFQHTRCGKCNSKNVKFVCRKDSEDNDWLEIQCQAFRDCGAKLVFSTVKGKSGEVYPKTRWNHLSETQQKQRADEQAYADSHNGFLPYGGWFVYKKKD